MIYLLLGLIVIYIIAHSVWNGTHGKGYNAPIKLPSKGSKLRLPVRIVMLIVLSLLLYTAIQFRIDQGHELGKSESEINLSIIIYFLITTVAIIIAYIRYKKNNQ
jgi:heme/copper-type cytochrome/quinol oxidase subunit 2